MHQVVQDLSNGTVRLVDVPVPIPGKGSLLIRTSTSLVSAGTERMLIDFGRANWLERVRQQPDKVRQVIDKMSTDGLVATIEAVRRKLDQPMPMGYANVGVVVAVGDSFGDFAAGDRVVSNGPHAGFVCVAKNLCARIPESVDDTSAAFTVLGAIALQGIRLATPTLGEVFVVSGLGLVGLLAVQLLRANGCQVLGIDFDKDRLSLARGYGAKTVDLSEAEDPVAAAFQMSGGTGVDGVIVCVASDSDEPMRAAAKMCRKRGRIVLVGVTGLKLARDDFYKKELSFQVSCSYGPGRYDTAYEELGQDYPLPFVRWTEQRNFDAVLALLADGKLDVRALVSHRIPVNEAPRAYDLLSNASGLGILFDYSAETREISRVFARSARREQPKIGSPVFGVVGVGGYASAMLLPNFTKAGATLKTLVSAKGLTASHYAERFDADASATDVRAVLDDPTINAVIIATRHDSHARLVLDTLRVGKYVFVEKPLATNLADIEAIKSVVLALPGARVMVGFNRRFSPLVQQLKTLINHRRGPKSFVYTVNAGAIPPEHWTQGAQGGGRIIGEACHFIDLLRFLCGTPIRNAQAIAARDTAGKIIEDVVSISLQFEDGSLGTIHYFANGSSRYPKERLEVFAGGGIAVLDNFKTLRGYGWSGIRKSRLWRQDKGQTACAVATVQSIVSGAEAPIAFEEIIEVATLTCELVVSLRAQSPHG